MIIEADSAVLDIATPLKVEDELDRKGKVNVALNKISEFYKCYNENKIYLSKRLINKLNSLYIELVKFTTNLELKFRNSEISNFGELSNKQELEKVEVWVTSWDEIFKGEARDALQAMEDDFRELLGVE